MRPGLLVCALLATVGCYWGRRPLDDPTPDPRYPVWIWSGGSAQKWHAVRVTWDSVSGIPYHMSVHCDSCRQTISRDHVDSIRVAYQTPVQKAIEGTVAFAAFLAAYAEFCHVVAPGDRDC